MAVTSDAGDFDWCCDVLDEAERMAAEGKRDEAYESLRLLLALRPPDDPEHVWLLARAVKIVFNA